jgi:hypothetical protein
MGNDYKYIINMGLAFDEDRLMKKLSKLAKEGWLLKEMTVSRYKLEKGEPQELIYSMDYKILDSSKDEYFELFEFSGWKHVCTYGPFHFFAASPGTIPIYTDRESYLTKYKHTKNISVRAFIFSTLSLLIVTMINIYAGNHFKNEAMNNILILIGMLSAGVAVPSLMMTLAYMFRSKKRLNIRGK